MDNKLHFQAKLAEERHEADLNFFHQRVTSLQEQFKELSNKCAHAQESIEILKYMLEKNTAPSSSSTNARNQGEDANPEDSTAH